MHLLNDEVFIMHKYVFTEIKESRKMTKWSQRVWNILLRDLAIKMKKAGIAGWWKKENYYDESN